MNNGSKPINPLTPDNYKMNGLSRGLNFGLTKREYFAVMAMQGFLSADTNDSWPTDSLVRSSVKLADALLMELEASDG